MSYIIKLVLLGEANVGKTSLVYRFIENKFRENYKSTLGVNLLKKDIEHSTYGSVSAQIWDLGGQERFRYLLENFVMGARGALLLFDLTRMPKIGDILEWVNIARLHDLNLPILLIGTKSDLEDVIAVDDDSALHLKNTFNMIDYIKTSAKTGFNIEELYKELFSSL